MPNKLVPTIGLEIHAELKTASKMFCSCVNNGFEKKPNFNVCPICLAHPGTLPTINKKAVKSVIKTGLALNCQIPEYSQFDRKNYFYPDIPKGYQISQNDFPLCRGGYLIINNKKIRITRIHLEEDTGKLYHEKDSTLVDFNRAGVPLMELVTEPDIKSGQEARLFAQELQTILRYLNVSDADMEKGQMRIEVNISLSSDKEKLGTKVEIKNLNSFRSVERAINYEIERQAKEKVVQETRGWDEANQKTKSQRKKESAHDYRYFPEPDLPPVYISKELTAEIKREIQELPQARKERFQKEYNIDEKTAQLFVLNKDLGDYFEKIITELKVWQKEGSQKKEVNQLVVNYLIGDLQGLLKGKSIKETLIDPENFAEFIFLISEKKITSNIAKLVLAEMFKTGADPSHIIEEKGFLQFENKELEKIIDKVILENPEVIDNYKKGKIEVLQFLIGQVMKGSRGKADPQETKKQFLSKLS